MAAQIQVNPNLPSFVPRCSGVKPDVHVDVKQRVIIREGRKVNLVQRMLEQRGQSGGAASGDGATPARVSDERLVVLPLPRRRSAPPVRSVRGRSVFLPRLRRQVGARLVAEILQNPQRVLIRPAGFGRRPGAVLPPALGLSGRVVSALTAAIRAVRSCAALLQFR